MKITVLTWNGSYSTGLEELDGDHRQLFEIINRMTVANGDVTGNDVIERVLDEIQEFAASHCKHEEKLMERHGYPLLAEHRICHQKGLSTINQFCEDFRRDPPQREA